MRIEQSGALSIYKFIWIQVITNRKEEEEVENNAQKTTNAADLRR